MPLSFQPRKSTYAAVSCCDSEKPIMKRGFLEWCMQYHGDVAPEDVKHKIRQSTQSHLWTHVKMLFTPCVLTMSLVHMHCEVQFATVVLGGKCGWSAYIAQHNATATVWAHCFSNISFIWKVICILIMLNKYFQIKKGKYVYMCVTLESAADIWYKCQVT